MQLEDSTDEILPIAEVIRRTSLSSSTIWRLRCARKFPAPVQLSARRIGWRRSEVDLWIQSRMAADQQAAASIGRAMPMAA